MACSGSVTGQGGESSSSLFALDFREEIHSVFSEVMLGQNVILAKITLCCLYFFLFLSFICLLLWFLFGLCPRSPCPRPSPSPPFLHCLLCTVCFLHLEEVLLHSRFLFGIYYALFSPFFLLHIEMRHLHLVNSWRITVLTILDFFLSGGAHLPHFW